ncbi:hypothetical protein [Streptomyces liangshanensis]|uniref:Lipoprotein n=1 Tax=Streptomyces liangshanensis TaxID=2717324 RepID=A0A6G9H445_9ACTN|nr:hypothetical protein [Streptomyces liangshanensis]QIQ05303.1 hypothetical protein HA039_26160 [Streptomyces liangshanensis]
MSVTDHRRLGIAAGAVLLTFAVAGCSGLGRTSVGTIVYESGNKREVQESNPRVTGCHRLVPGGAVDLTNRTLVDMKMYRTPDCSGKYAQYIATTLNDVIAPGATPWRSYRFVH